MKNIFCYFMFCMALSITSAAQSKDEKEIARAVVNLRKASIDGNEQPLRTISADELSYGHSSGKVEDKETFVKTLVSGKSDFVTIELTDQTIKIASNTAIVRHNLSAKTNDNGNPGFVKLGIC